MYFAGLAAGAYFRAAHYAGSDLAPVPRVPAYRAESWPVPEAQRPPAVWQGDRPDEFGRAIRMGLAATVRPVPSVRSRGEAQPAASRRRDEGGSRRSGPEKRR
jgi:hypothetical protein